MKKVSSLVLALVMAVCLAVPAFAAPSQTTLTESTKETAKKEDTPVATVNEEPAEEPVAVLDNGLAVEGAVNDVSPAGKAITSNLGKVLQNVGITVAANQTCSIAMLMELDGDPGTYTFNVPTAGPADKVIVLHWNGGSWEKVGEGYGSSVSAYFAHFSPVAIVVIKDNGAAAAAAAGTGALKAPQTGDSMAVPFVAFAVIALAGVVAVKARKEEL